ncbi:MAG: WecB/TagA/CpsF family glycosyltransferase [Elusimicrobia bacterium]|nr:WecB/TagA/CpsF family glycosyltransferase [Elusimicrobiota bacterium]
MSELTLTKLPPSVRIPLAGVCIDLLREPDVVERVKVFVGSGECHQIITANPLMIMAAEKDPALRAAFDAADLVIPDSAGVQWAARMKGHKISKIAGIDLMDALCAQAAERSWRVYFLGAAPGVAETAAHVLTQRHKGLQVAGIQHGYFARGTGEEAVIHPIAESKPDLLFVALSTPVQDGWIHKNLSRFGAKVVMGVGGSFDVLSGRLRRAPAWMRTTGLEWFFRLLQEPGRATRMIQLPVFAMSVMKDTREKQPKCKG